MAFRRRMWARLVPVGVAVLVGGTAVAVGLMPVGVGVPVADAAPEDCLYFDEVSGHWRVRECAGNEDEEEYPGEGEGEGNGSNGPYERPDCVWEVYSHGDEGINSAIRKQHEWNGSEHIESRVPEDVTWWWRNCESSPCNMPVGNWVGSCGPLNGTEDPLDSRWTDPVDIPVGVPVEIHLLGLAWVELSGFLVEPDVAADPPLSEPAIVDTPAFVEATNWPASSPPDNQVTECISEIVDWPEEVCVTVTWDPSLWFDPGDGAGQIDCQAPGSREDGTRFGTRLAPGEEGDDLMSADGACGHTYTVDAASYEATVGISYELGWESTSGWSGEFYPIDRTTSFGRQVDEVQTYVSEAGLG